MSELTEETVYSWRYRITVNVDTPEGLKSGSAVREVEVTFKPRPEYTPHPYHSSHKMRGEAVAVDLGERGVLFALITPDSYPEVTATFRGPPAFTLEGAEFYSDLKDAKATLDPTRYPNYPQLVTFTDPDDPKSVENILTIERVGKGYSTKIWDRVYKVTENRMDELFGDGVRIESITVEMTDDPVTWGVVETYLPKNFKEEITDNWRNLPMQERGRLADLIRFKQGQE